ncbi:Ribose import ATP-binding protein RbsA [Myxococcaceae bacterium]|nr:Ribose import ATP-binding protein RbsA [Myxococcaceae bacterium]
MAPGEIHALLGENGAGKSTLMNVLIGLVRPDTGSLCVAGAEVVPGPWSPRAALRSGVAMVHQHSTLVPAMSVPENLCFGAATAPVWFRPARERERVERLAGSFGLDVPVDARVEDLSVGQRQRAEILRALDRGARVLVLDEPTAALTAAETRALFPALARLRDRGVALLFISHKLDEIREIADRVTVLRRGRVEATVSARETSATELGRLMLGHEIPPLARAARVAIEGRPPALALRDLEAPGSREAGRLRGLRLEIFAGEIVGVAGIDGNGQRELEEVLAGVREPVAGEIEVDGRRVRPGVRSLRAAGVAHVSGERERGGLVPGMSVAENLAVKSSYDGGRLFARGLYRRPAARENAIEAIRRFGIDPPDPDRDVATLSGGNAQKVAVARELASGARVLVAVNPTRGLDVGSARFVHEQILALRDAGGAVLLVSTELDEVLALADRVVAMVRGRFFDVARDTDTARLGAILLGETSVGDAA